MKAKCGRILKNSNRDWIKRTVVFLEDADELKSRRRKEKCSKEVPKIENQVLAKRPSTEESLVR